MKKILMLFLAPVFFIGCFEVKEEIILNPDGSGKAIIEVVTVNSDALMGGFGAQQKKSESSSALSMIEKSKGVDVWKDVTYGKTQDGRLFVKGTAYFSEFNKLKIESAPSFRLEGTKEGQWIISVSNDEFNMDKKSDNSKTFLSATASKEERMAIIEKEKQGFQAAKAMMGMFLGTIKMDITLQVPGKVISVSNLKKDEKGRIRFHLDGSNLMEGMDVFQDEKWINDLAAQKKYINFKDAAAVKMNQRIFGEASEIKAVAAVDKKNLFDYAQETAKAKEAYPALLESLGGKNKTVAAKGDGFSSMHAIGIQYYYDTEGKSFQGDSYKMNFVGEFAGEVSEVKEILFTSAVADNGENLLKEDDYSRKASFPQLSSEKNSVSFDITMQRPSDRAKGIREITGTIEYQTASEAKEVDLGITNFTQGAQGKLGAHIESIGASWAKDYTDMKLKLNIPKAKIASIKLYDENHTELFVTQSDISESPDAAMYSFSTSGEFPKRGSVIVKVYDEVKIYSAPFSIKDVDLFGRPLKK
jgi:hypothetical protein